jgi:hypothetical protein
MNPLLISALIAGAVGFGSAWTWQGYRMDAYKLGVTNEQLAREQSTRQAIADAQAKVTAAQDAAKVAADRIKRDAAGANSSALSLRDALAGAVRSASADLQACTGQVDALSVVFAQCTDVARTMAVEADEWTNQAITLQSAWPK